MYNIPVVAPTSPICSRRNAAMETHTQDHVALVALRFDQEACVTREHVRQEEQGDGNQDGYLSVMGKQETTFEVPRVYGMIITAYDGPLLFYMFTNE